MRGLMRRVFRRVAKGRPADSPYDDRLTRPDGRPILCPDCGSADVTAMMTGWIIGHQVKDDGRTSFCNFCKACGHRWEREPYF